MADNNYAHSRFLAFRYKLYAIGSFGPSIYVAMGQPTRQAVFFFGFFLMPTITDTFACRDKA